MTIHLNIITILLALIAINAFTYMLFWYDKRCSKKGHWRVSEAGLLLSALLGGSPAAFLAMKTFRHKTKKTGFRTRFWLVVILQLALARYVVHHMFQANA